MILLNNRDYKLEISMRANNLIENQSDKDQKYDIPQRKIIVLLLVIYREIWIARRVTNQITAFAIVY